MLERSSCCRPAVTMWLTTKPGRSPERGSFVPARKRDRTRGRGGRCRVCELGGIQAVAAVVLLAGCGGGGGSSSGSGSDQGLTGRGPITYVAGNDNNNVVRPTV